MLKQHFQPIIDWWNNREEIEENGHFKAKNYSIQEIVANEYNIAYLNSNEDISSKLLSYLKELNYI